MSGEGSVSDGKELFDAAPSRNRGGKREMKFGK